MYALTRNVRSPLSRRPYWAATEDFFRPFYEMVNSPMRTNVKELEDAYRFEAELPGFDPSEIDLSIQEGVMTVSAEHKEGGEEDSTLSSRSIRRSFSVEGVDEENISAEYKNGILRVMLPKEKVPEALAPRKIEVQG